MWLETNNLFNNLIQRNQSAAFSSGKVRPNHETNINIIARRTGKDVNSHTVLDGIITTIMATIQRINIIGSREGSRNRRRRSEERFSRNAETDLVCRLLLEKKNISTYRTSDSGLTCGHSVIALTASLSGRYDQPLDLHSFPTRRSSDLQHKHYCPAYGEGRQ